MTKEQNLRMGELMMKGLSTDEVTELTELMALYKQLIKLFAISGVVGRSEQFNCPFCNSTNIHQKTKSNDWCKDCEKEWAV
jgi:transposase-like protein